MINTGGSIVRFWPHSVDENIASFRMRCQFICNELKRRGFDVSFGIEPPDYCDVIVLSYRHDLISVMTALELKKKYNTKIILDIVDNHFIVEGNATNFTNNATSLRSALSNVDVVITSSNYMKSELEREMGEKVIPIHVIDDIVEAKIYPEYWDYIKHFRQFLSIFFLKQKLRFYSKSKQYRILWYGNYMGDHPDAGMICLLLYKDYLEELARKYPVTLTVISNSRQKYNELIHDWNIPNFYLDWNKYFISQALVMHGVVVLPIKKNVYTLSKSANRVTKSLAHGLQVVADEIPSYSNYANYTFLDNPLESLRECLEGRGKDLNSFNYKNLNDLIVTKWQNVLFSI